jgi:hypothetical protein
MSFGKRSKIDSQRSIYGERMGAKKNVIIDETVFCCIKFICGVLFK